MVAEQIVFVVDDDQDMRESLRWLFESAGLMVKDYHSAEAFLENYQKDRPGCLVLDVRMPGMGGFGLLHFLAEQRSLLSVIVITGHGDVPMAVRALKQGVIDFIQKPFNHQQLLERVNDALHKNAELRRFIGDPAELAQRWKSLTPRERDVVDRLVDGKSNKVISGELKISQRTVEAHRSKVMEKMGVRSLALLVRVILVIRKYT